MYSEASTLVSEAAEEDRTAAVETWGPEAFARRTRAAVHGYRLPPAPGGRRGKGVPTGINILLFGPTGSGKSSLIYTWFRALTGSVAQREDFFQNSAHKSLLQRLSVGWNGNDVESELQLKLKQQQEADVSARAAGEKRNGNGISASEEESKDGNSGGGDGARPKEILAAAPRHGTTAFEAYELQAAAPDGSTGGICVHDTKGQQFFSAEEEAFAEQLLRGKLRPGSSAENRNYRYWLMLGQFGILKTSDLATSPHVLVLVFDVSLRSFESMLREGPNHELCACYRRILWRARQQEHDVYAALTHVDMYNGSSSDRRGGGASSANNGQQQTSFDRSRDLPAAVARWKTQLSAALADARQPGVAPDRIYAVENYRKDRATPDAVLELASLEFLESTVRSGCRYVQRRHEQQQGCLLS